MKKILKCDVIKNYVIILVLTMLVEAVFRLISNIPIFDVSFLRIFLGLNFISILLSFLLSWTNKTLRKILIIFLGFVFCAYAFFQIGFNNFIGVYASINASSQLGAVVDYIMDFFGSFLWQYYLEFIPFVLLIVYYIFFDKKIEKRFERTHRRVLKKEPLFRVAICGLSLLVVGLLYMGSLSVGFMQNDLQMVSNKDLFDYPTVPSIAVNQFGVLGFGVLDIRTIGKELPTTDVVVTPNRPNTSGDTSRKIDDTLWRQVIEKETDEDLNEISNYLINRPISDYNDHTGLAEGKNLIVVMMESMNEIIINEDYKELYPNMNKMYSEGIAFVNNYSPRNNCSTGNNEFSGMTSLYTIQNNCTSNRYRNNKYYEGIFNLFRDAGYRTSSMHNYTEQYYYRSTIHTNIGSEKYYGVEDMGIKWYKEYTNWSSDEDFARFAMDTTLNGDSKPFMLWLTTVSTHQPYNRDSVEAVKYRNDVNQYISEKGLSTPPADLKRFMSKLKTFDNFLGILMARLEEAGELDNTVIAMYSDHYPYAMSKTSVAAGLNYTLEDYEADRTPMLIWSPSLKHEEVEEFTSYMTLTPTLANLFNLDYDPRLYFGTDVFSDEYVNAVVFDDGSWRNDKVYYDASKSKIKNYKDETMSLDEIKAINTTIAADRKISTAIIKNNYFDYLDDEISKLKPVEEVTPPVEEVAGS